MNTAYIHNEGEDLFASEYRLASERNFHETPNHIDQHHCTTNL